MSVARRDPDEVIAQYEALRRDATASTPGVGPSHGLVLFLARGMAAWLDALSALAPPPPHATLSDNAARSERIAFAPTARTELTTVLAAMVLACTTVAEEVGDESRRQGHG